jgi:hypothetical protein
MTLPHAAGSLYSTVQDMYRWDRSLYTNKVLTRQSLSAMFTPVKNDYGYGLALGPMFKHKQIGHRGGINGFTSMFERFPDDDATVIVLSNVEGGSAVARGLTAILFGEKYDLPVERKAVGIDPRLLDRYAGAYESGAMKITVRNESGRLTIEPTGQSKAELYPMSDTEFFLKLVDATITFVPDENGIAKQLVLNQGGMKVTAKRVK